MTEERYDFEKALRLEKASDNKLICKNCGSELFNVYENKAYHDYRSMFMVVTFCAKCGLMAHSNNFKGWTKSLAYRNETPIDNEFKGSRETAGCSSEEDLKKQ